MKKIKIFFLSIVLIMTFQMIVFGKIDDISNHWGYKDIIRCIQNEYINGYNDNTFRPDNNIKYNEFIKIIVKSIDSSISNDIKKWDEKYLEYAKMINLISDEDKDYNELIKRKEVFEILYKYIKFSLNNIVKEDSNFEHNFKDVINISEDINFLCKNNIVSGYPDNTLRLEKYITRAEITILLNRVIDYIDRINYASEKNINIFLSEEISHFTNYESGKENIYENEYYIKDNKIVFTQNNQVCKIVEDNELINLLLNLINNDNYVLLMYEKDRKCINIQYGDTLGYILNQDKIIEIEIFEEIQQQDRKKYRIKIVVYRLWKEIYEICNNFKNTYYIQKLKNVLDNYIEENSVKDILEIITEEKELGKDKYIIENKNNVYYIFL